MNSFPLLAGDGRDNHWLFLALAALIAWAPLPLGGNRAWAWAIMEAASFSIMAVWLARHWNKPFSISPALSPARFPLALLCLWLLFTAIQIVPAPAPWLKELSPASHAIHSYVSDGFPAGWAPISIDPSAGMAELLKYFCYAVILFLVLVLADTPYRLKILAMVMVLTGFAEALYGLLNTLSGIEYIWFAPKVHYRGFVTGTFINRNHLAGHLEMVIPLAIGLLLSGQPQWNSALSWKARIRIILTSILENWGPLLVYTAIMFSALFLSGSRGGAGSLFFAFFFVYIASYAVGAFRNGESGMVLYLLILALTASVWLGLGQLPERYETTGISLDQRMALWRQTLNIAGDYPWFGSGAGAFAHIFPLYDSGISTAYFDHAHNDYVELLADQGLIGSALLGGAVLLFLRLIILGLKRRRDHFMRGILFGSLTGLTSLMFHAAVDFNFHIPANAAYFFVLIGMGLAAASAPSRPSAGGNSKHSIAD